MDYPDPEFFGFDEITRSVLPDIRAEFIVWNGAFGFVNIVLAREFSSAACSGHSNTFDCILSLGFSLHFIVRVIKNLRTVTLQP